MANTIVLAKNYVPLLDEVYKRESVTADLTGDPAMARAGANAAEIVYPQIAVTGLGDYNRNSGYTQGTVGRCNGQSGDVQPCIWHGWRRADENEGCPGGGCIYVCDAGRD